ncbi:hypothetical protein KGQ24_02755 [Patescibacteria group bacterium]|nr:hypothetical protein [Patescibacteria group bacterium]
MKFYATFTAFALLALGILGFAFNGTFNVPTPTLLIELALGIWGLFAVFRRQPKQ